MVAEIDREIRNARHYLRQLPLHEIRARAAYDASDAEAVQAVKDAFLRDLSAFLNAARTAKNYLTASAVAAGQRAWLDTRLAAPTFKFHADLAGTVFHDGAIKLERILKVQVHIGGGSAQFAVVPAVDGTMNLHQIAGNVSRVPMAFQYDAGDLGPALGALLKSLSREPQPIVDLAIEYVDGLEQVAKNAVRNGRLAQPTAE